MSEITPSLEGKCPFCQQSLSGDALVTCTRCRTLYHPKCWEANFAKCAVYGCAPKSLDVVPPTVPPVHVRVSQPNASKTSVGCGLGLIIVLGLVLAAAIGRSSSQYPASDSGVIGSLDPAMPQPPSVSSPAVKPEVNQSVVPSAPEWSYTQVLKTAKFIWWDIPERGGEAEDYRAKSQRKTHWVEFTVTNSSADDVGRIVVRITYTDATGDTVHVEDVIATGQRYESRAGQMPNIVPARQTKYFKLAVFAPKSAKKCRLELVSARPAD